MDMGVLRFRLRSKVPVACRGLGWPLKKTENDITVRTRKSKVVSLFDNSETTFAQAA
tara:strand:- start:1257 stop:1427 length:171 start_codon:yes stop_codon:yes gene_type:complete